MNARRGFGSRLIKTLARQLQAEVSWAADNPGTTVTLRFAIRPVDAEPQTDGNAAMDSADG